MNRKMIIYTLGQMLKIEGILMFLPFLVGCLYHEKQAIFYMIVGLLIFFLGIIIGHNKPKNTMICKRGVCYCSSIMVDFIFFGGYSILGFSRNSIIY